MPPSGPRLTAVENQDGSLEPWDRRGRTTKGKDLARSKRLLIRFGIPKDSRIEETWIKEGFFVTAGVRPSKVPSREMSKSSGLIVTSQFACPSVEGCTYISEILGESCEDQAIAGGWVPNDSSVSKGSDLERQKQVRLYIAARL